MIKRIIFCIIIDNLNKPVLHNVIQKLDIGKSCVKRRKQTKTCIIKSRTGLLKYRVDLC